MPAPIPARYAYLKQPGTPALIMAALETLGTIEGAAGSNNPTILRWADEVAKAMPTAYNKWAADWYNKDSVAWCGLAAAVWAIRSAQGKTDRLPPKNYLSALAWAAFGIPVQWRGREGLRLNEILVGDAIVMTRNGGGHIAFCVGVSKDGKYVHCIGGNQDNAVSIKSFPVSRIYAVRRPPYNVRPAGARHVRLDGRGEVSRTEA